MTILITADLHLDLWVRAGRDPFTGVLPVLRDLDALIIAGDLANNPKRNWPRALSRITRLVSPARIWVIPGNHDYYGAMLDDNVLARIAVETGANLAQKQVLTFGNYRLLCCTLWTDFALTGDPEAAMARAGMVMPDYGRIRRLDGDLITPEDTVAIHRDHLEWLTREMAKPWPGQTVIVTHHAPGTAVSGPISGISPAFASDLDGWIEAHRPDYWFFGHTHRPLSARIRGAPVINVSVGYPDEVPEGGEAELLLRGLIFPGA
ncbi:metallophosphoesterase family protein [Ketogulonicigenium vulgare]|uniref:Metallophosphoesterase n=1 Tax=Ketogulonicigenium vulgare (strain WSH-001) TaxID=759362 RepID=F9YBK2_KETVW|nr:metallophosphoesterase [Ketogulonicigenium vulgare]AEM42754.1 Metallophosphoesterase [Ketogulonicigenium vulgare WSH-001]ALJ82801.1 metallophosphoesterase [Ketogulonicigenium vulgare]